MIWKNKLSGLKSQIYHRNGFGRILSTISVKRLFYNPVDVVFSGSCFCWPSFGSKDNDNFKIVRYSAERTFKDFFLYVFKY